MILSIDAITVVVLVTIVVVAVVFVVVVVVVIVVIFIFAVVAVIIIYVYLSKCSSSNLNSQVPRNSSAFAKSLQSKDRRSSMKIQVLVILSTLVALNSGVQLSAKPDGLYYNGKKVFLSGVNIAWNWYGYDFGNNKVI